MADDVLTYLLVDGENIDGALGGIFGRKPEPGQRPRWQQLLGLAEREWKHPVRGLFFINASRGHSAPFVQMLMATGFRPILLAGRSDEKVVDIAIQRTLAALVGRDGDVLLASHDGDFVPQMTALVGSDRNVGLIAFPELVSQAFREVPGLVMFDLETDAAAFDVSLPRVRVIPLDRFDPLAFL